MGVKMEVKLAVMRYAQDICWGDSRTQDIGGTPKRVHSHGHKPINFLFYSIL